MFQRQARVADKCKVLKLGKDLLEQAALPLDDELTNVFMEAYATAIIDSQANTDEAAIIFFKLYINIKLALFNEETENRSNQNFQQTNLSVRIAQNANV